jgi:sterol desaturase/sphingolipid hydroxylase (fatty acid hydroxylase superfamily)
MEQFWNWLLPLWQALSDALYAFLNPKSRVFLPYLLSALVLAGLFYAVATRNSERSWKFFFQKLLRKDLWWHPSARVDYGLLLVNNLVRVVLIAPYLMAHLAFAYTVVRAWEGAIGYQEELAWSPLAINLTYTIVFLLVADFSRFFWHYCLHRIPLLWELHKVHHAAEVMTPLTLYRVHPIEYFLFRLRSLLVFGWVSGSFFFWFRTQIEPFTILNIHAGLFLFNLLGANLRHSHIPLSYGKHLERWFISPAQHQLHHSQAPEHHNKNFGSLFAFWDRLLGSLLLSRPKQRLAFGIEPEDQSAYKSLWQNLWTPIKRLFSKRPT